MKNKLVIMDMDGTLLNRQGTISERTRQALLWIQQQGAVVVLASGRSWKTLQGFGEELQMDRYGGWFIGVNGAALTECATKTTTVLHQLSVEAVHELFDFLLPWEVEIMGVQDATIFDYIPASLIPLKTQYRKEHQIPAEVPWTGGVFGLVSDQRRGYSRIVSIQSKEEIQEPVNKVTVCHTAQALEPVFLALHQLADRYHCVRTSPQWIEISEIGASKGEALRILQQKLGIEKAETIIFGDGENDLSMLGCGTFVAMGNAMETVKAAADRITADNDHDGIAVILEEER